MVIEILRRSAVAIVPPKDVRRDGQSHWPLVGGSLRCKYPHCKGLQIEDEEWVKHCLMDYERRRCISKVLSVTSEAAVPKGNNYCSDLYRLNLKVVLHSGEMEERPVIYKALPISPDRRISLKESGVFAKEGKVYKELLPVLEEICRNINDDEEPSWVTCYAIRPRNEGYLLEDLAVKRYKMANKIKGLDFNHAAASLKALAKFHALTAIAIEQSDIGRNDFGSFVLGDPTNSVHKIVSQNLEELSTVLEQKWAGEWVDYAKRVRNFKESYRNNLPKDFQVDENKFSTINHGDCGLMNMLFKYDGDGTPSNARLIDFQMSYSGRPGADIQYLLQTSLGPGSVSSKPQLLQIYYNALVSNLQRFGYSSELPTFQDIKEGYDKAAPLAIAVALAFRPFVICESEDAPDLEELSQHFLDEKSVFVSSFGSNNEDFIHSLKSILRDAKENGYL